MKLTKTLVDRAIYEGGEFSGKPGRHVLWDDQVRGFGLRLNPEGTKTFVLSYRVAGRKRLVRIARYGVATVEQARKKAAKLLAQVDDGIDPLERRREARRRSAEARTVADLCDVYLERHARVRKKTWAEDERKIETLIKPALGRLRVAEVTRDQVADLYHRVGEERPYLANRLLNLLSAIFNLAIEWGFAPEGFRNPAAMRRHSMYRERRRDRPLKTDELPRLLSAIAEEPSVHARSALTLLLLTGLRKREVLGARWEDIDFGRGTLRLPDTKAGRPRHAPLSSAALGLIRSVPREAGNDYVFSSPSKRNAPLGDLKKPWERVREKAGCPGLRIHDLRHTVATWLAEDNHAAQTIQAALGHQNIAQTMGYVHAGDQGARQALEELGEKILAINKVATLCRTP